jgi:hypothetical protein
MKTWRSGAPRTSRRCRQATRRGPLARTSADETAQRRHSTRPVPGRAPAPPPPPRLRGLPQCAPMSTSSVLCRSLWSASSEPRPRSHAGARWVAARLRPHSGTRGSRSRSAGCQAPGVAGCCHGLASSTLSPRSARTWAGSRPQWSPGSWACQGWPTIWAAPGRPAPTSAEEAPRRRRSSPRPRPAACPAWRARTAPVRTVSPEPAVRGGVPAGPGRNPATSSPVGRRAAHATTRLPGRQAPVRALGPQLTTAGLDSGVARLRRLAAKLT